MASSVEKFMNGPARPAFRVVAAGFVLLSLAGLIIIGIHALDSGEFWFVLPLFALLYCVLGFSGVVRSGRWFRFRKSTGK